MLVVAMGAAMVGRVDARARPLEVARGLAAVRAKGAMAAVAAPVASPRGL